MTVGGARALPRPGREGMSFESYADLRELLLTGDGEVDQAEPGEFWEPPRPGDLIVERRPRRRGTGPRPDRGGLAVERLGVIVAVGLRGGGAALGPVCVVWSGWGWGRVKADEVTG